MPGSITLPQVILDLEDQDRTREAADQPPRTVVCRYGHMRLLAELPFDDPHRPGCGSKLVIRTGRGIELAEMLTTTCANGGCGLSVSRKQMLDYIGASGGRNFPFSTEGRVLRTATAEDIQEQARLDARKPELLRFARELVQRLNLSMKLVEGELLLGGERIIFHYASDQWVDFRELVRLLAAEYQTRIEMHQVNSRDEARLVADYEKCGQHCCCRQFLKVLAPISMRSAKTQKATLDPTKISGRCGRLMCCLRFEDQTYDALKKKLPHRQSRTMTPDGPGTVMDTQILSQLVLVALDNVAAPVAFPLEQIRPLARSEDPKFNAPNDEATGGVPDRGGDSRAVRDSNEARNPARTKPIRSPEEVTGEVDGSLADDASDGPAENNSGQMMSELPPSAAQDTAATESGEFDPDESAVAEHDQSQGHGDESTDVGQLPDSGADAPAQGDSAGTSSDGSVLPGQNTPADGEQPGGGRRRRRRRRRGRRGGGNGSQPPGN